MIRKSLKRKCDWVGLTVETRRPLQNHFMEIPTGTRCTVTRNRSGLTLQTTRCEHCGISVFIHGVDESQVLIIPNP